MSLFLVRWILTVLRLPFVMTGDHHFMRHKRKLGYAGVKFWDYVSVVAGVTLLALAAHFVEISM